MAFSIKRKRLVKQAHDEVGHVVYDPEKRKRIVILLTLFILLASNGLLFYLLMESRETIIHQQQVLLEVQEPPDAGSEVSGEWYGLCDKNRVYSINDFRKILGNDSVLATYFSDFDWENARMGKLENALWAHVSYRKSDRLSTTRRAIRLPKGDGYITDGKRWLRTYSCADYVPAGTPPERSAAAPDTLPPVRTNAPDDELDKIVKSVIPNSTPNKSKGSTDSK